MVAVMEIDPDRIYEAVLALLCLGRHQKVRTWKSFDWAALHGVPLWNCVMPLSCHPPRTFPIKLD